VEPDAGPSKGSLLLLKNLTANLSSPGTVGLLQSLASVASRIAQLPVAGSGEAAGTTTTLARRSQSLLIAHLEGRTSATRMGAQLHVHFTLEPEDFLRWYHSTPNGATGRGADGSDAFFVRSSRERSLAEGVGGGPTNTPAYNLRYASYHEKDGKKARQCLGQPPAAALALTLRKGWSGLPEGEEAHLSLVLHPCRPRLGIAMAGVAALRGNAAQCAVLLRAGVGLDAAVRAALAQAPPACRLKDSDGKTLLQVDAGLAVRLGDAWGAQLPALTAREDAHYAALEAGGVHVLALWETSPWVYVALLRGAAAASGAGGGSSAGGGVKWAGPPVQPQDFVQSFVRPWGRTREEDGTVYFPV
jgi:hypothetical protein